jgi:predicted nucleic acid-binding protein
MILVDTSVWIDLFAGKSSYQVSLLHSLVDKGEDLCTCGVVFTEVLQGIRDDRQFNKTKTILSKLLYLPMTKQTYLLAATAYRMLQKKGVTIRNAVDCMIAAVCIEESVDLLHSDKDFNLIAKHYNLRVLK